MKLRQLKGKTLPNYDMSSVFIELYHIEKIIKDGKHVEQKNYIIIRLVTIIEQFFRKVLEFLFRRHPETRATKYHTGHADSSMISSKRILIGCGGMPQN